MNYYPHPPAALPFMCKHNAMITHALTWQPHPHHIAACHGGGTFIAQLLQVVKALEDNEARIFHWVEQVYFRRWWLAQTRVKQESVRNLIKTKRLVFMTGGLCMNDEATPHHGAIIDQMTWGHRFINATFGDDALPTVGWQIDAFGHSAGYTSLTTDMGLDYFIGQKIDFQDWGARAASEELEFEWTPDPVNKPGTCSPTRSPTLSLTCSPTCSPTCIPTCSPTCRSTYSPT